MKNQVFATLTVNLLTLIYGICNGSIAPNIVRFQEENSPISQITPKEAAVVVSIMAIGGLLGSIVFVNVADLLGRKWTLILLAFPQLLSNGLFATVSNPIYVCVARFFVGLSAGGIFTIVPMFVSEVTEERVRGAMGTIFSFTWNLGVLLGYVLASWVEYFKQPFVGLCLSALFLAIFVWFPDSPDYLQHKGLLERAEKAYDFYGNHREPTAITAKNEKASWSDFKSKAILRGCAISLVLLFFCCYCGFLTVSYYVTELLTWANLDLDVYATTVGMGFIQVLGCGISSICVDRLGRRILFMTSATLSSLSLVVFGLYFYILKQDHFAHFPQGIQWMAIIALACFILGTSLAISGAPFMVMAELVPTNVRARAMRIFLVVTWIMSFSMSYLFYPMVDLLGVDGAYWVFSAICASEALFVYFILPETKNLSIEEIQTKLQNKVR